MPCEVSGAEPNVLHIVTVGCVPTVGGASDILHCRELRKGGDNENDVIHNKLVEAASRQQHSRCSNRRDNRVGFRKESSDYSTVLSSRVHIVRKMNDDVVIT